ncbi:HypC/HybG/HupF family hydrogenase formation chaperone [Clostridium bowmanii]|uniref:HypC/HybG/HupF family hydrogenase formation chaperone n=1 Tax=Clostridium bowmanii TaxID=132925 RepID=UPI001C0DF9D9|nr:HypC/HybG/HupF family hydrogenase formation chaperone [Clostridium bowmanii]MBU3188794.1 HypC/HybG/HupF family hydrogenase formation chaperone [Clostridium bowmanii]MCA1073377.1 HypC/HybG/HupF family hydrogenase formation chaperone [Clostridium bowmanii]
MCLAVPGKVVKIEGNKGIVEIGNVRREIFMHLVPDVCVDEYVLVHAGCAIETIDEEEAKITLDAFKELLYNEVRR